MFIQCGCPWSIRVQAHGWRLPRETCTLSSLHIYCRIAANWWTNPRLPCQKICSKGWWCSQRHQGRWEGRKEHPSKCEVSHSGAKDHNWPQLTKTPGIKRMQACLRDTLIIYAVRIVSFVLFKMARGFAENVCEIIWSYFGLGKWRPRKTFSRRCLQRKQMEKPMQKGVLTTW